MSVVIVTGSSGLVGSESVDHYAARGFDVVGIDNHLRGYYFGEEGSTRWKRVELERRWPRAYVHVDADIRDREATERVFRAHGSAISLVVHAAAQPSHDWAAREPRTDFEVNAMATLTLLEAVRAHAPDPLVCSSSCRRTRCMATDRTRCPSSSRPPGGSCRRIIRTLAGFPRISSAIDRSAPRPLFGASKVAADVLVQEYGRYFGLRTASFRCGCLTGPAHSATEQHGFLAHLLRCTATGTPYTVFGYQGKQVRDILHSGDLVRAFDRVLEAPPTGAVYNMGGGRACNCSVLEAIAVCEEVTGRSLQHGYSEQLRVGDHQWWISDVARFQQSYPGWAVQYDLPTLCREMYARNRERWGA